MVSVNVKRKLNNIDQVIDIEKHNEFNLIKEDVNEAVQQSKSLDIESKKIEWLIDFLKDPNDDCEFIIAYYS